MCNHAEFIYFGNIFHLDFLKSASSFQFSLGFKKLQKFPCKISDGLLIHSLRFLGLEWRWSILFTNIKTASVKLNLLLYVSLNISRISTLCPYYGQIIGDRYYIFPFTKQSTKFQNWYKILLSICVIMPASNIYEISFI